MTDVTDVNSTWTWLTVHVYCGRSRNPLHKLYDLYSYILVLFIFFKCMFRQILMFTFLFINMISEL